jgi:hypothetical protein
MAASSHADRLVAEPLIAAREYKRHAVMDIGHQFVGVGRDDRKGAYPLARARVFPIGS